METNDDTPLHKEGKQTIQTLKITEIDALFKTHMFHHHIQFPSPFLIKLIKLNKIFCQDLEPMLNHLSSSTVLVHQLCFPFKQQLLYAKSVEVDF